MRKLFNRRISRILIQRREDVVQKKIELASEAALMSEIFL